MNRENSVICKVIPKTVADIGNLKIREATMKRTAFIFFVSLVSILAATLQAQDQTQTPKIKSTSEIMTYPMNVLRGYSGDAKPVYDFYGKILGFKQLTTVNLDGGVNVARFEIGSSQLKFRAIDPNRKYRQGAIQDATGLRLLTFFYPSRDPVVERFRNNELEVPEFRPHPGSGRSSALVQDPTGQWVELVIAPDEPKATYDQIEIGLVVSNLDISRKFYRDFIGIEELPPVEDPVLNTTKYPYRHGSVTVSLRCFGHPVPADMGSGEI